MHIQRDLSYLLSIWQADAKAMVPPTPASLGHDPVVVAET